MSSRSDFRSKAAGKVVRRRKKIYTPNAMHPWTKEDEIYLREHWGNRGGKIRIAMALGRSIDAIKTRAVKLKFGPYIDAGEDVSFNQLFKIINGGTHGSYKYTLERWKSLGFPMKVLRNELCGFMMVNIPQFWRWAKKNQNVIDFSRFEENALGKEPAWVKTKRRIDIENHRIQQPKKCPWSFEELERLRLMLEYGATYYDLERELNRTSGAIRRKIYDLHLPKPKRSDQIKWTDDDMRILVRMINQGYNQDYCAKMMNRSCQAVRGRIEKIRAEGNWNQYE